MISTKTIEATLDQLATEHRQLGDELRQKAVRPGAEPVSRNCGLGRDRAGGRKVSDQAEVLMRSAGPSGG